MYSPDGQLHILSITYRSVPSTRRGPSRETRRLPHDEAVAAAVTSDMHARRSAMRVRSVRRRLALGALGALCVLASSACARADGEPRATGPEGPVVLELFTSQGCSSCPPADALLSKLASSGSLAGRSLAPLAFHVDYWNDLGWADPFSLPAWTERQHQYARVLKDDRVYTPELVVGGTT